MSDNCFIALPQHYTENELPEKFTFPFYYTPHQISLAAAADLQQRLKKQDWDHNFGLDDSQTGMIIGKMFGVLVVQKPNKEIGYLAAFSGKLGNQNNHTGFVPPIFDMLKEGGFFKKAEKELMDLTEQIDLLENTTELLLAQERFANLQQQAEEEIQQSNEALKVAKKKRKIARQEALITLSDEEYNIFHNNHKEESLKQQYFHKKLLKTWEDKLETANLKVEVYTSEIKELKKERKAKSNQLQQRLFSEYQFSNANQQTANLSDIFKEIVPPSGSGDCAAPKLLNYAYQNQLKPICMAEFWWGASPKSEIRKHQLFYPSCNSKCKPILGFMLQGLTIDDNPFLVNDAADKAIEIVFEDADMLVINKPIEMLSVPGKEMFDSVYTRIRELYPDAEEPIMVHRLDMSTSGIMLLTKSKQANKLLQKQFLERSIKKRYVALLDGVLEAEKGEIDLPLRVDIEDRPRQLVCFEHGKNAKTHWKIKSQEGTQTKVYFYPVTGRTHQLRVHASHHLGLNTAIVGDDLYGQKKDRLCLHAESITFTHPKTKKKMTFKVPEEF
ncbi:RluA family pseudouridine synthase [bacterium]|nr:RluA family pseudouridine synthase [bacterium]